MLSFLLFSTVVVCFVIKWEQSHLKFKRKLPLFAYSSVGSNQFQNFERKHQIIKSINNDLYLLISRKSVVAVSIISSAITWAFTVSGVSSAALAYNLTKKYQKTIL